MKKTTVTSLSAHLIQEAARYVIYPHTQRRTQDNVEGMELVYKGLEQMVEQYTTFFTSTTGQLDHKPEPFAPELLDNIYCRGLLRSVPEMVERTRSLAPLTSEGFPDEVCLVYLKEAAKCYIYALPQASIALTRTAVETALIQRDPNILVKDLAERIDKYAEKAKLSPEWCTRAHKVRRAANDVLHRHPKSLSDALGVIEDARKVILELGPQSIESSRLA